MNRRKFFGMTLAGLAVAGLPEILMPERTIFLPPKHGWHPHAIGDMYLRETSQYVINWDEMMWRYDAIGRDTWGNEVQFHVNMDYRTPESHRLDLAKQVIGNRFREDGLTALRIGESSQFQLALPRTVYSGRYV